MASPADELERREAALTEEVRARMGDTPPIPHDGPVGELLAATRRSPMRPAHIHFMVAAPGHHTLVTHVFAAGSEHLEDDAVFGVKPSLVREFEAMDPGADRPGSPVGPQDGRWWRLRFDIALAPADPDADADAA